MSSHAHEALRLLCSTGALSPGLGYADLCRLGRVSRALSTASADALPLAWAGCTGGGSLTAVGAMLCRAAETGHAAHAAAIAAGAAGQCALEDNCGFAAQCLGRAACAGHFATVDALLAAAGRRLLFATPFAGGKNALHVVASRPGDHCAPAAVEKLLG